MSHETVTENGVRADARSPREENWEGVGGDGKDAACVAGSNQNDIALICRRSIARIQITQPWSRASEQEFNIGTPSDGVPWILSPVGFPEPDWEWAEGMPREKKREKKRWEKKRGEEKVTATKIGYFGVSVAAYFAQIWCLSPFPAPLVSPQNILKG